MTGNEILEIRRRLVEDRRATLSLIEVLDADEAGRRSRADAWSIKDHVAHLSVIDEAVISFVRRILAEERPVADSYDVDVWNAQQRAERAEQTWEKTLAELSASRERLLVVLEDVPPEALSRIGSHPVWGDPITLGSVLRVPYRHERGHRDEIKALTDH
jgi:uncharacterized damage-inducible protein DinB